MFYRKLLPNLAWGIIFELFCIIALQLLRIFEQFMQQWSSVSHIQTSQDFRHFDHVIMKTTELWYAKVYSSSISGGIWSKGRVEEWGGERELQVPLSFVIRNQIPSGAIKVPISIRITKFIPVNTSGSVAWNLIELTEPLWPWYCRRHTPVSRHHKRAVRSWTIRQEKRSTRRMKGQALGTNTNIKVCAFVG